MSSIYISGPMTGLPDHNFPAFNEAANALREAGFFVLNPADNIPIEGRTWAEYLRADIKMLCECDAIMMLPGWQKSQGAHLELHIAHRLEMQIQFYEQWITESNQ